MTENENYWLKHLKRNNIGQIRVLSYILDIDVSKVFDNKIFSHLFEYPKAEIESIQDAARELVGNNDKYKPLIRFIKINKKILIKNMFMRKE